MYVIKHNMIKIITIVYIVCIFCILDTRYPELMISNKYSYLKNSNSLISVMRYVHRNDVFSKREISTFILFSN